MNPLTQLKRRAREKTDDLHLSLFLQSREAMGVSPKTLLFYRERLSKFIRAVDRKQVTRREIVKYLNSIPPNKYGLGTRHASYRTIKTFYRWLHSENGFINPMEGIPAPILSKPLLPSLEKEQVIYLIDRVSSARDKAIISLFTESGLRLSELANIKPDHINWANRTIRVVGKGRKEALAAFGALTNKDLCVWLEQYTPYGNVWGINESGIVSMLRRLEVTTGLPCNPHTYRRTFACLLRKAGVDTMTIKDLGRWESLEMVQRYTRSFDFHDSLKFYIPPLS